MRLLIITQKVDKEDSILGFFHGWISHLSENFEEIIVITLAKGTYSFKNKVEVVSLGKEKGFLKIIQGIKFYWYLFKFLPKVDGVFIHMAPEYVRALFPVNLFFRKPVIMWYAHIKVSLLARWALSRVDKILTPSKESFSLYSEKVVATGHGMDTDLFKPENLNRPKPPIILTMSRIAPVKRLNIFIEALRVLREKYPDLKFKALITGKPAVSSDYDYLRGLEKKVEEYNLGEFVEWYGEIKNSEMPRFYNEAEVFVRLQGGGGFGKQELAALSCGTPAVMPTDVYNKDLGEFAEDLYFPEDDFEKCAENIAKVLNWSVERRAEYVRISRSIITEKHNLSKLALRIREEFEKLK